MRRIKISANQNIKVTTVVEMTDKELQVLREIYHSSSYAKLQQALTRFIDTRRDIVDWSDPESISLVDDITGKPL